MSAADANAPIDPYGDIARGADIPSRRSFVCVMFMDIRDFTPLVEQRSPEDIVRLQNAVLNRHHAARRRRTRRRSDPCT